MAPVLGYWKCRGLTQPLRLILTYAGQEFTDKLYEFGGAPNYDNPHWTKDKFSLDLDFPNLPYYIDGDLKVTQSNAILRYLARKHNLEGKTEEERVRIDILQGQIEDLRNNFVNLCYGDTFEQSKGEYAKNLPSSLKQLSTFLGERKFFAGNNLTYVDFLVYEYLHRHLKFNPEVLKDLPNLRHFFERFEALPRISEYVKKAPASNFPYNSPKAKWGF